MRAGPPSLLSPVDSGSGYMRAREGGPPMSVYVGIDVHRKRSQIAVVDHEGAVQVNRNVPNGVGTVLGVIGDLPIGAPVAFEAAYGWGWLVELLEDYGFEPHLVHPLRCKAIASARLKNKAMKLWAVGCCQQDVDADGGFVGASVDAQALVG